MHTQLSRYLRSSPCALACLPPLPPLLHAGERGCSVASAVDQARSSPQALAQLPALPPPVASAQGYIADVPGGPGSPSFVADCFFMAQKMLHVGIMPAVFR